MATYQQPQRVIGVSAVNGVGETFTDGTPEGFNGSIAVGQFESKDTIHAETPNGEVYIPFHATTQAIIDFITPREMEKADPYQCKDTGDGYETAFDGNLEFTIQDFASNPSAVTEIPNFNLFVGSCEYRLTVGSQVFDKGSAPVSGVYIFTDENDNAVATMQRIDPNTKIAIYNSQYRDLEGTQKVKIEKKCDAEGNNSTPA